jgi:hypothetical protein
MSVTVTYESKLSSVEVLETNVPAAAADQKSVTHTGYNTTKASQTAASTPPVTKCAYFSKALSAGAASIDLTALTGTNGAAVDFSGLKVQYFKFKNPSTNANAITVEAGASNGYLLGGTGWTFELQPGAEIGGFANDASPDVSGSTKTIDLSGTGTQALEVSLVAG